MNKLNSGSGLLEYLDFLEFRLVPLVDKALLPLRILRLVTSIYLQVENPTQATAHAPEKIFQHKLQIFSVAIT